MKLIIGSPMQARVCDWESSALLRDNAQHILENGEPTERFEALHAIEAVVDEGACRVGAARLRGEVLRAFRTSARAPRALRGAAQRALVQAGT